MFGVDKMIDLYIKSRLKVTYGLPLIRTIILGLLASEKLGIHKLFITAYYLMVK